MITGLLILLGCQLIGEFVVTATRLPIPGPVLGMVLLLVVLGARRPEAGSGVTRAGDALLRHLQLLFVPAGVGVVAYTATLAHAPLPVLAGLVLSWVLVVTVTAGVGAGTLWLQSRLARTRTGRREPTR
ncbi:MAG TPA: CidA/LrgA family protein [Dermatophilaceae bacterium]|nr:CidA/LrgA family protein [Dermatophilaceae bacterium]